MADGDKLPAAFSGRGIALSEQSGSLVARGLEAIKNRQQGLVLSGVEPDAMKSFLEGVAAERRRDYAEAVKWYRKAADQGYAEAQLNLAFMYVEDRAPDEANEVLEEKAAREGRSPGYYHDQGACYAYQTEHWLRLAAEQGYVKAQSKLGVFLYDFVDAFGPYMRPQVAGEQLFEAAKWLRLAAEQGEAEAQYYLGIMYGEGRGVTQDFAEAVKWYRLAAGQGNADAAHHLGLMYIQGEGLPQDYADAIEWFMRAAERGHSDARFNLGAVYANGQGVPQDYMRAYMWLDLAARSASDTEERDKAVKSRDSIASNLTFVQIAEAQRLLREARENHAS